MTNIFENAYFGKSYKTRDGRKAIYLKCSEEIHRLILEDGSIIWIKNDGKAYNGILESSCYDIVSEWTIDEEELEDISIDEGHELSRKYGYDNSLEDENIFIDGFKEGYRKALGQ